MQQTGQGVKSDHLFLPAMVLYKDGVADHDVAEGCYGDRHQPGTDDGQMQEEGLLRQLKF